ncbi:MAG: DUF2851 family protein [Dysgonamonadaceae bacterium]|jgi:hypothetical protein|nr:DUF2851 family protein [Dysgonamonadaceae bacterium]
MEALSHYVWKYKLYESGNLFTSDGKALEILDAGVHNSDAGPDFFNAKIKIDGETWAGNVEIHTAASDWNKHRHFGDKAYNSVVLHVVERLDLPAIFDRSGRSIPQWVMAIPERIKTSYRLLLYSELSVPCLFKVREIPEIYLSDWKNALLTERLERKTGDLLRLLDEYRGDWNEMFYVALARSYGFGINNDAFERLAKSLPLKIVLKHHDSPAQIEALFLGQAGLLDEEKPDNEYYSQLRREYIFFRKKYKLTPLESYIFRNLRTRPNNFPHIKILQLAGVVGNKQGLASQILETAEDEKLHSLFVTELSEFWFTHYHFEKESIGKTKYLGMQAKQNLLINVVVPLFFAYGKKNGSEQHIERAFLLLESLKPEKNHIVTLFDDAGVKIENAGDTQALIQLKREYCEKKKCMYCRIGHRLLAK